MINRQEVARQTICPRCWASAGTACVSLGGRAPKGTPLSQAHDERLPEREPVECGTYAGLNRHNRLGTPICEPCRAAGNDYMRKYRNTKPDKVAQAIRRTTFRNRALARLATAHREEYEVYLAQEMAEA